VHSEFPNALYYGRRFFVFNVTLEVRIRVIRTMIFPTNMEIKKALTSKYNDHLLPDDGIIRNFRIIIRVQYGALKIGASTITLFWVHCSVYLIIYIYIYIYIYTGLFISP
jgi:hypothetical protein